MSFLYEFCVCKILYVNFIHKSLYKNRNLNHRISRTLRIPEHYEYTRTIENNSKIKEQ